MIITMNDILPNNKNNKHIQLKKRIISNATNSRKCEMEIFGYRSILCCIPQISKV